MTLTRVKLAPLHNSRSWLQTAENSHLKITKRKLKVTVMVGLNFI